MTEPRTEAGLLAVYLKERGDIRETTRNDILYVHRQDVAEAVRIERERILEAISHISWESYLDPERAVRDAIGGPAKREPRPFGLSDRQYLILYRAASGMTQDEIASELGISPRTVSEYLDRAYQKIGLQKGAQRYGNMWQAFNALGWITLPKGEV